MARYSGTSTVKVGATRLTTAGWLSLAYAAFIAGWLALSAFVELSQWDYQFYTPTEGTIVIAIMVAQAVLVLAAIGAAVADLRRSATIKAMNIAFAVAALATGILLPFNARAEQSPWLFVFGVIVGALAAVALALHAERPRRAALAAEKAGQPVDELAARRPRRAA